MANSKISNLTENTTPIYTDLLVMVDDPAGTPVTQKLTVGNLFKAIPDTGGTTRITLATASPHVILTGNVRITGSTGVTFTATDATVTGITMSPTISAAPPAFTGIVISPSVTTTADSATIQGLTGIATLITGTGTTTISHAMYGLNFKAVVSSTGTGTTGTIATFRGAIIAGQATTGTASGTQTRTLTVTDWASLEIQRLLTITTIGGGATVSLTVTTGSGIKVSAPTFSNTSVGTNSLTLTSWYGIWLPAWSSSDADHTITTAIGLKIEDQTGTKVGTTLNALVNIGPSTPYFRVMGNFTAAANQTPIYISEGATPTLRQLQTKAGNTLGAGDLVCVLV